jgi:hypothetical protein
VLEKLLQAFELCFVGVVSGLVISKRYDVDAEKWEKP